MTKDQIAAMQAAFDKAGPALLRQNCKSEKNGGGCYYRGAGGRRCAIGWLIDNDEIARRMDNNPAHIITEISQIITEISFVPAVLMAEAGLDALPLGFLQSLQAIHDRYEPSQWRERLIHLAASFHLSASALNSATPEAMP
jgi:hypothetical protein